MSEAPPANAGPPSPWVLACAFNRIALASFGGGLSAWSREVIVAERGWMSEEEFLSASTICRVLPGANQVNMAVFVGTKLHGAAGAVAALAGLIALPMLLVLVAGALYLRYRDVPGLQRVLAGMASAAVGLVFSVAWHQGRRVLSSPVALLLFAAALAMAAWWRVPLWLTLLLLGPLGYGWAWQRSQGEAPAAAGRR
jgi:chromate transporter